LSRHTLR